MIQLYPENDLGYAKLRKCKKFSGLENIMEMSMQAKFKDREVLEKSRFENFNMLLSESNLKILQPLELNVSSFMTNSHSKEEQGSVFHNKSYFLSSRGEPLRGSSFYTAEGGNDVFQFNQQNHLSKSPRPL